MSRYVVANWKANKTLAEARQWVERFLALPRPPAGVKVIVAPAFPYLVPLGQLLATDQEAMALAVQDISSFPFGSYTGAVAAEMVAGLVGYALVGHAERRRWFHETNQDVANKAREALAVGITPIICVDQPYARAQLAALTDAELKECLIGYGPVEAVGVDIAPAPERIRAAVAEIKAMAPDSPVLYGGAVQAKNAATYMKIPGLAGLMAATAAMDPQEFAHICREVGAA